MISFKCCEIEYIIEADSITSYKCRVCKAVFKKDKAGSWTKAKK